MVTLKQNFTVFGEATVVEETYALLASCARREGWARCLELEAAVGPDNTGDPPPWCFLDVPRHVGVGPCKLGLTIKKGEVRLTHLVFTGTSPPTKRDANAVVFAFVEEVLQHVCAATGAPYSLSPAAATLEELVPRSVAEALRAFSARADRACHPSWLSLADHERWSDFVVATLRTGTTLDPDVVEDWLVEDGGWPPEDAAWLAKEYFVTRALHGPSWDRAERRSA